MDQEVLDRASRLKMLSMSPVWKDLLDVMEGRVKVAEDELLDYNFADQVIILARHRKARSYRTFVDELKMDIDGFINLLEDNDESEEYQDVKR